MADTQLTLTDTPHLVLALAALLGGAVAFTLAIVDMRRDPPPGSGWFAASIPAFVAAAAPFEPFGFDYDAVDQAWAWRIPVMFVIALPALLLHLVTALSGRPSTRLVRACDALTVAIAAWIAVMPTLPGPDHTPAPWWYTLGFGVFLLQFLVTIVLSVRMLVLAARGSTGAARMRGRLLALTFAVFGVAYLSWFLAPSPAMELAMSLTSLVAALLLWLAIRAPRRLYELAKRDQVDAWQAIEGLVASSDVRAELPEVLTTTAHDWGLLALAIIDVHGEPIESVGTNALPSPPHAAQSISVRGTNASVGIEAWASPLTPPLLRGDRERLTMLAHLIELALSREDTTRRQQEVDRASRSLEQRVLDVEEQLRRAEAIRDRAARVVATDMRGPIHALLGLTDALETRWHELPADQLQPLQQLVARQVARLASVVDKLLVMSAIEDGTLRSAPERVDVRRLIDSVLDSGIDAQVDYRCDDGPTCCVVTAEPVALREILTQLLDNAASHGSTNVEVQVAPVAGDVLIEVLDYGQGVREAFVPLLFDRFTRDSSKVERGLGLGLAIVHELAATLGGTVGYRRDDRERTVFWLRLPGVASAAA